MRVTLETRPSRPFSLSRYFTGASLVIVFAAFVTSGLVAGWLVHRAFLNMEREEADSLAEDIEALFTSRAFPAGRWGEAPVPAELRSEVRREMENFGIVSFTIFSPEGVPLEDFAEGERTKSAFWREGFETARMGQVALRWASGDRSPFAPFFTDAQGAIESYIPIHVDGRLAGVARVHRNLSPTLQKNYQILPKLMGLAGLSASIVFAALWVLVRKADRILERQHREIENARLDLEARNRKLAELNQRKDEFTAICSHDLRGPLVAVQAGCKVLMMERKGSLNEAQREILEENLKASGIVLRLVDDLLDLARIEAGVEDLELEELELGEVVREAIAAMREQANARRVRLDLETIDGAQWVRADRLKILRVLINLLSNAIKYSPEEAVSVRVESHERGVRISVADRGPGIPLEERETLFDRFSGGSRRKKSRDEGTGLGLSIVRHLVDLHGGTVSVASDVGRGATFTVVLPRHDSSGGSGRTEQTEPHAAAR